MKEKSLDNRTSKKRTAAEVALWMKGVCLTDIANQLECKVGTVCLVIKGRKRSRRIEATIARTVGERVETLFPGHGWPRGVHRRGKTIVKSKFPPFQ